MTGDLVRDGPVLRAALRELERSAPPERMDFGLGRVREAAARLGLLPLSCPALVVGGTNGKGSVTALLAAVLTASGRRTGLYTSPHLHAWRERIAVDGRPLPSRLLAALLLEVRAATADLALTYFEVTTLVALAAFRRAGVEAAVLEVGLGGRLDAVNIVDSVAPAVVSVDLDHCEWLGPDRESIGREKAGIFRAGRPALVGDPDPPASLLAEARARGADLWRRGTDFADERGARPGLWTYRGRERVWRDLPRPALAGAFQIPNAALALAVLEAARDTLPCGREAVERGLREARLAGRLETVEDGGRRIVFDVAHNPAAARTLARELDALPRPARSLLVLGMLADKDSAGFVRPLVPHTDGLVLLGLPSPRGLAASALAARLEGSGLPPPLGAERSGRAALERARRHTRPGDRIIVTGSFRTVAALREAWIRTRPKIALPSHA